MDFVEDFTSCVMRFIFFQDKTNKGEHDQSAGQSRGPVLFASSNTVCGCHVDSVFVYIVYTHKYDLPISNYILLFLANPFCIVISCFCYFSICSSQVIEKRWLSQT